MTFSGVSSCSVGVSLLFAVSCLRCGSPPLAGEPGPADDVTVPEPPSEQAPSSEPAPEPALPAAKAPRPTLVPQLAASLEDGYESYLMDRVKVFRGAKARAHLDDEVPPKASDATEFETLVVQTPPTAKISAIRAVVDTKALRALLWFDEAQTASVITERTELAGTHQGVAAGKLGVTLHPGLGVTLGQERGGRVHVEVDFEFASPDSARVSASGWVEKNKVGHVFQPAPPSTPTFSGSKLSHIDEATEIFRTPGGAVLAKVEKGEGGVFFPVSVLGARGAMREVYFAGAELEVRGFVRASALEELEPETARGWGRGYGGSRLWQRWPKEQVVIPRGTCIYDRPGGEAIGVFKLEHVENVVIPSEGSPYRAYRLPYDAVAQLYASDLSPVAKGTAYTVSKEPIDLKTGSFTCPKRPN